VRCSAIRPVRSLERRGKKEKEEKERGVDGMVA
jgi:hypothetical protein